VLLVPTPPRWLERVLAAPDELLHDVVHCEKKAAGTVLALVFKDAPRAAAYSRLAREELGHFEQALALLVRRGGALQPLIPARYAGELARAAKGDLCATLCVAGIIEARSAERLDLLRTHVEEPDLRALYAALHPPEERHVALLLQFAGEIGPAGRHLPRLLALEAELVAVGEPLVRVHA
jgi:tRNA 2-(methylsulfanyl)-N6-isopentenyladenosine37 hydroxylase